MVFFSLLIQERPGRRARPFLPSNLDNHTIDEAGIDITFDELFTVHHLLVKGDTGLDTTDDIFVESSCHAPDRFLPSAPGPVNLLSRRMDRPALEAVFPGWAGDTRPQ